MAEFSPEHLTELMFAELMVGLSTCWPASSVAYVADMVGHGEYGEALENLAAMSKLADHPLDTESVRLVTSIGDAIEVDAADLLRRTWLHTHSGMSVRAV